MERDRGLRMPFDVYPKEVRAQPLPPPPPVPIWKTWKGVIGGAILILAIIGAIVGIVVSTGAKKSKIPEASGAAGTSSNGTVAALGGAGVAAVSWPSNGQQVRLYIQKDDGFVYEAASDQNGYWNPNMTQLFRAKAGTPLAAVVPAPSQVHLYYLDTSNILQEYIYNNSWTKGATPLPSTNIAPITSLAATTWTDSSSVLNIRLYYQKQDNTIQELAYSTGSGWSSGYSFTDQAYPGAGLGAFATYFDEALSTGVYWQGNDLNVHEYIYASSWSTNLFKWSATPSSGITAIGWQDTSSDGPQVRVYYENTDRSVEEVSYSYSSGWTMKVPLNTLVDIPAPISATVWVSGGDVEARIYVKNNSSNIHIEITYSGGWTSKVLSF
ncbi:hypothetical protein BDN72DRAFT_841139 [Pluteus cervinus]|uniref:Uncharacterized protein n=1 Tax=Pluteus cervinus TaxID=181527 RepID=A0ACD3ASL3_9AGAR|nr:hypothetical protein BDN72DRAFT_841139 [Pluteus cervinus]